MAQSFPSAFAQNFLGAAPRWYKQTIVAFLIINPVLWFGSQWLGVPGGKFLVGWLLLLQFIFTLAMALRCYPLQPGGLLAIQAVLMGMTSPETLYLKTWANFPVILLLIFMVAGIFFLKEMLLFVFTRILLGVRSKVLLSLLFCSVSAVLSAYLDALTVTAVIITVAVGFYRIYHGVVSEIEAGQGSPVLTDDSAIPADTIGEVRQFRSFLRGLMMHAAVGTALGGVTTLVGEPQNLLLAKEAGQAFGEAGWEFAEFFIRMAPVTLPVLVVGLATCALLEISGRFGYGTKLSPRVRGMLERFDREATDRRPPAQTATLVVQGVAAVVLIVALSLHQLHHTEVGLIGLMIIVLATAFTGVVEEHRLGKAFAEALPFTALLVVFFGIVAVIYDQKLFKPITEMIFEFSGTEQLSIMYLANGLLSIISDNVFVATVYIGEVREALAQGLLDREQFELMVVAINTGTNIPSVGTPNGQAAFLFLLTSALAPAIRLSYGRMVLMALPYTIVMTLTGLLAIIYLL
ncbi:MAG: sodium/proton antiporter NhaB [Gammaproteobacteria bacterium]|nr:sodium/proton antiporter NhaB [Gammaproteobacteria bacterium]